MVAAARKHQRVVQRGNQRRSWPGLKEMVEKLRSGVSGSVLGACCWYSNARLHGLGQTGAQCRRTSAIPSGKARRRSGRTRTTWFVTTGQWGPGGLANSGTARAAASVRITSIA